MGSGDHLLKRVIIAEDEVELGDIIKEHLELLGVGSVNVLPNGQDAYNFCINLIRDSKLPHLIITDIRMPKMTGMELLRKLRGNDHLRNIPIMILTAYGEADVVREAISLGVSDVVAKPFDAEVFKTRVNKLLGTAK